MKIFSIKEPKLYVMTSPMPEPYKAWKAWLAGTSERQDADILSCVLMSGIAVFESEPQYRHLLFPAFWDSMCKFFVVADHTRQCTSRTNFIQSVARFCRLVARVLGIAHVENIDENPVGALEKLAFGLVTPLSTEIITTKARKHVEGRSVLELAAFDFEFVYNSSLFVHGLAQMWFFDENPATFLERNPNLELLLKEDGPGL